MFVLFFVPTSNNQEKIKFEKKFEEHRLEKYINDNYHFVLIIV